MRLGTVTSASPGSAPGKGIRSVRVLLALMLVASLTMLVAAPAGAVTAAQTPGQTGTWVGQITSHGGHFDYGGSICPIQEPICIKIFVTFRIVPITPEAAAALPGLVGGQARLMGSLALVPDASHRGTLFVWRASKA